MPGGTCALFVRFTPQQVGNIADTLFVDAGEAGSAVVPLFGTGLEMPKPVLTVSTDRVAYGDVIVGTSAQRDVNISNTGNADMPILSIAIQGGAARDYSLTNRCPAVLPSGAACTVSISFTASELGARNAELRVTVTGATNTNATVALTANGIPVPAPVLQLSATQIAYGNSGVGGALAAQQLRITNSGALPLNISSVAVTGDFAITQPCGTTTLAAGMSCTVQIAFVPTDVGTRNGELRIMSNATPGTSIVTLSGRGCGVFSLFGLRTGVLSCGN
jgi:hypothetical protein